MKYREGCSPPRGFAHKVTLTSPIADSRLRTGNSGEVLVTIKSLSRARSYDVRYAPAPAGGGTPTTWTTATFASARTAVSIGGLTPGTNYLFQVRAFGKLGHTDWSDSVARICAWEERCNGRMKGGRTPLSFCHRAASRKLTNNICRKVDSRLRPA
jgi:hypothetical protein